MGQRGQKDNSASLCEGIDAAINLNPKPGASNDDGAMGRPHFQMLCVPRGICLHLLETEE